MVSLRARECIYQEAFPVVPHSLAYLTVSHSCQAPSSLLQSSVYISQVRSRVDIKPTHHHSFSTKVLWRALVQSTSQTRTSQLPLQSAKPCSNRRTLRRAANPTATNGSTAYSTASPLLTLVSNLARIIWSPLSTAFPVRFT